MDIFNEILILNSKTVISSNGISPIYVKECAYILSHIIHRLFSFLLPQGIFLTIWKSSFINPIFKKRQ